MARGKVEPTDGDGKAADAAEFTSQFMTRSTGIGVAKFPAASLAAACLLTMVAACGRGNADGSPSYTVGYVHGCDSGFTDLDMRVNFVKDENRFRLDADYRKGWREGHAECYAEGLRTLQQGGG